MTNRAIVVTVGERDWLTLVDAAEAAGMTVEDYASWCVRIFASQARPTGGKRSHPLTHAKAGRRKKKVEEESESAAWVATFSERLSHRVDRSPEV